MRTVAIIAALTATAGLACSAIAAAQDANAPQAAPEAAAPSAEPAVAPPPAAAVPAPELNSIPVQEAPASEPHLKVEEVIVTAQRRAENLQTVPISITVFNQEQLAKTNITNSSDLATYTPSLSVNTRFGTENATFAIRGFTQDLRTTASVGTYFAEVVAPRGQTSQSSGDGAGPGAFFDLENVQVLKGPQGTLFGRNTTGGAVLIVPRKPQDKFEGYLEGSGGDFDARRIQGVLNYPFSSTFKLRFGVDWNKREGYLNNILHVGADKLGDVDYTALRLSGLWDISESLDNYTILTYTDSSTNGQTARLFQCNSHPNPSNTFAVFSVLLTGPGCQAQLASQAASGQDGFYDLLSPIKTPITAIRELRGINTTTWDMSMYGFAVKNIFAYSHLHTLNGTDVFGTHFTETAAGLDLNLSGLTQLLLGSGLPITLPPVTIPGVADPRREFVLGVSVLNPTEPVTNQNTMVDEIQLQSRNDEEDKLSWQTGLYYEHSLADGYSGNNSAALLSCQLSTIEGDPSQYNCFDPLGGFIGSVLIQQYKTDYLNQAAYAQATYKFTDWLSLTAGLRYTLDSTHGYGVKTRYTFVGAAEQAPKTAIATPETRSKAPTGMVEVSVTPNQAIMTYAKFVRGYRQGSVNLAADPGIDTFRPEKVNTYEIGAKTSFEGAVAGRFNMAGFYNDFTNMQLQFGYISPTSGTTTAIFNAGKSKIAGAEADGFLQFPGNFNLTMSYTYLDTKLISQDDHKAQVQAAGGPLAGFSSTPIADTGDTLPFAPKHAAMAALNYRLPVPTSWGGIEMGPTYVYTSSRRASATSSSPNAIMHSFSLLNANLNWIAIFNSSFDLAVFATNVLDKQYETYISGTYNVLGFDSRMMGQPRMIGARLRYNFGAYAQ
jgi:outer membrane receptor protein involved in Fe transport